MRNILKLTLTFSFLSIFVMTIFAQKGNLFQVEISLDNNLRAKAPMRDYKGVYINSDGSEFKPTAKRPYPNKAKENFTGKEIDAMLTEMAAIIKEANKIEEIITPASQDESFGTQVKANTLGSLKANAGAPDVYSKLKYFPKAKVKKLSDKTADEYYEVNFKFLYGGAAAPMIVMDKEKKPSYCKYRVKTTITAFDKAGKKLWTKSTVTLDFSESVEGTMVKKNFKLIDTQKVSLKVIKESVMIALKETLKS